MIFELLALQAAQDASRVAREAREAAARERDPRWRPNGSRTRVQARPARIPTASELRRAAWARVALVTIGLICSLAGGFTGEPMVAMAGVAASGPVLASTIATWLDRRL